MTDDVDVLAAASFRIARAPAIEAVNSRFRSADGTISINSAAMARLLGEILPDSCFVSSRRFSDFPLFLCWRIEGKGVLARVNHYMPYCIRASALKHPLRVSIDPVDGRFIDRHMRDPGRIRIIDDTRISAFGAEDDPLVGLKGERSNEMSPAAVAKWLSEYWDRLRGPYFHSNLKIGTETDDPAWRDAERQADEVVTAVLSNVEDLQAKWAALPLWRKPSTRRSD